MQEVVNRINELINDSGMDRKSFSEKIGISPATLSHISSGRNNPSLDLVLSLLKEFNTISPDWLLFGKGNKERQVGEVISESSLQTLKYRVKLLKMLKTEHYRTEMNLLDELDKKD